MTYCGEPGCGERADFATPYGFRCGSHAIERLTRDVADGNRGWVPLRFSRSAEEVHDRTLQRV